MVDKMRKNRLRDGLGETRENGNIKNGYEIDCLNKKRDRRRRMENS